MQQAFKWLSALILLLFLPLTSLKAQEPTPDSELEAPHDKKVALSLEARGDYQRIYLGSQADKAGSGFKGNIANVILSGTLSPKFSYLYRQRLSSVNLDRTFFESIDFLYLQYNPTEQLSVKLGKWIVFVGGWEFEPAPIDVFQLGEFCYQMPAYQWGATVSYTLPNGQDNLHAQVIQSPYRKTYEAMSGQPADMYAYNLIWTAHHDWFVPMWSVNFMEYAPGRFMNYVSLGNRFQLTRRTFVDLDLMHRAPLDGEGKKAFADYSIYGQLAFHPTVQTKLYLKGSYDQNLSGSAADYGVTDGTQIACLGGGVEYSPIPEVRLHAHANYAFGTNTNPMAVLQDQRTQINVGVTWRMKVL